MQLALIGLEMAAEVEELELNALPLLIVGLIMEISIKLEDYFGLLNRSMVTKLAGQTY
jgi:hypothetical protein